MEQPPSGGWRAIFSNERVTRNPWMPKLDTGHKRLSAIPPTICPRSFSYLKLLFTWRPFHLPPVLLSFILFFGPFNRLSANYCHRFFVREVAAASARYRALYRIFFSMEFANSWKRKKRVFLLVEPANLCKTWRLIAIRTMMKWTINVRIIRETTRKQISKK